MRTMQGHEYIQKRLIGLSTTNSYKCFHCWPKVNVCATLTQPQDIVTLYSILESHVYMPTKSVAFYETMASYGI